MRRYLVLSLSLWSTTLGQISDPHASDDQLDQTNKFVQRGAQTAPTLQSDEESDPDASACEQNVALKWTTEAGSSIYATPLITDLYSDGHKDIIVPAFVHQLEVVEGANGHKETEFGGHHRSFLHTSPLLYDVDNDGVREILAATFDAEIVIFDDMGEKLFERIAVGPLRVHRDWYVGLKDDPIDHAHPDVGDTPDSGLGINPFRRLLLHEGSASMPNISQPFWKQQQQQPINVPSEGLHQHRHLLQGTNQQESTEGAAATATEYADSLDRGLDGASGGLHWKPEMGGGSAFDFDMYDYEDFPRHYGRVPDPIQAPDIPLNAHADIDWARQRFDDYMEEGYAGRELWEDEDYYRASAPPLGKEWVWVDPHLMATPSIADIDGDGNDEMVMAVSYFFDKDHYADPAHRSLLPADLALDKYVASGVVAYSMATRQMLWSQHLDLSTALTTFQAFAYSAPTLVDLDRDGQLEVILGTSMGFLYVLDSHGDTRDGWPKQMAQIEAQVAVGDVDGDGRLELVAADSHGNLAVFTPEAEEVWEVHLGSAILQAASLGDVNGDGKLEVVVGTENGGLHVLEGSSGVSVPNFPFQAQGYISAEVLLTRLTPGPSMQLVFMAHDGLLYMVNGISGCADSIDVGEASYSMVLADDLDANGHMELVVTTMNGNVHCFETQAPYDPLLAWPSQIQGPNGMVARSGWEGIAATAASRIPRDVRGHDLDVAFDIVDLRPPAALPRPLQEGATAERNARGPYRVTATLQGISVSELRNEAHPVVGKANTYAQPGRYTLSVPCPRTRSTASVRLEMTDEHSMIFFDEFSVSFHIHFHRLLKWMVAVPFAAMATVAILLTTPIDVGLPTLGGGNHRQD
ncbi:hypothetical protein WJX74_001858 [Apatococcus lobatus]|uniref:DEX1 C-terminal domain-containing protein n=2 Tax=Apatococcus TaxID=904362 RepID=A0AAW1SAX6_9CHLO